MILDLDPQRRFAEGVRVAVARVVFVVCVFLFTCALRLVPEAHPARVFSEGEIARTAGSLSQAFVSRRGGRKD